MVKYFRSETTAFLIKFGQRSLGKQSRKMDAMEFLHHQTQAVKCGGVHHRHAFQHPPHRPWRIMWRIQQNGPMVSVSIHRKLPSEFTKNQHHHN